MRGKIFLVFFGVIFALLLLESGLWLCSFLIRQAPSRHVELGREETRILCVGESTTRGFGTITWPSQLETMLKQALPDKKIRVINQGIAGINSSEILRELPTWLKEYSPHAVIGMFGINDEENAFIVQRMGTEERKPAFYERSRLYRFLLLLFRASEVRADDSIKEESLIEKGKAMESSRAFQKAAENYEEYLKKSDDPEAYERLGRIYFYEFKDFSRLEALMRKGLEKHPNNCPLMLYLAQLLQNTEVAEAEKYYKEARKACPKNLEALALYSFFLLKNGRASEGDNLIESSIPVLDSEIEGLDLLLKHYLDSGNFEKGKVEAKKIITRIDATAATYVKAAEIYLAANDPGNAIQILEEAVSRFNDKGDLLKYLAEISLRKDDFNAALGYTERLIAHQGMPEWVDKASDALEQKVSLLLKNRDRETKEKVLKHFGLSHPFYAPATKVNYKSAVNLVLDSGIPFIAMQYPRVSLKLLQELLDHDSRVAFVGNEKNFEDALQSEGYNTFFTDRFGGSFGHLTDRGNALIASTAKEAVLQLVRR